MTLRGIVVFLGCSLISLQHTITLSVYYSTSIVLHIGVLIRLLRSYNPHTNYIVAFPWTLFTSSYNHIVICFSRVVTLIGMLTGALWNHIPHTNHLILSVLEKSLKDLFNFFSSGVNSSWTSLQFPFRPEIHASSLTVLLPRLRLAAVSSQHPSTPFNTPSYASRTVSPLFTKTFLRVVYHLPMLSKPQVPSKASSLPLNFKITCMNGLIAFLFFTCLHYKLLSSFLCPVSAYWGLQSSTALSVSRVAQISSGLVYQASLWNGISSNS